MDEVAKKLLEDVIQEVFENQVMPLSIDLQTRLMQYGNAAQQSVQPTCATCGDLGRAYPTLQDPDGVPCPDCGASG